MRGPFYDIRGDEQYYGFGKSGFEEYFLKKEDIREPVLMLWRNRPTIVVGAFQNTHEEICEEFVKANKLMW